MCPRVPVKLEFGRVGFWGEGSPEVPGEKPLGASEKNYNKLNPDVASTRGGSSTQATQLSPPWHPGGRLRIWKGLNGARK